MPQQVQRGERGMSDGVEVLVPQGGKGNELHAAVLGCGARAPAVHRHLEPPLNQSGREFFGEGLKAAIAGRNAASA